MTIDSCDSGDIKQSDHYCQNEDLNHFDKAQGLSAFLSRLPRSAADNIMVESNMPSAPLNNHLLERSRSLKKVASDKSFSFSSRFRNHNTNDSISSLSIRDISLEPSNDTTTLIGESMDDLQHDHSDYIEFYIPLLQLLSASEFMQAQVSRVLQPPGRPLQIDDDDEDDLYVSVMRKLVEDHSHRPSNDQDSSKSAYDLVLDILSQVDSVESVESVAGSDILDDYHQEAVNDVILDLPNLDYRSACVYLKNSDPLDIVMRLSQSFGSSFDQRQPIGFKVISNSKRSLLNLKGNRWIDYEVQFDLDHLLLYGSRTEEDDIQIPRSFIKLSLIDNVDIAYARLKKKQNVLQMKCNQHKEYYLLKFESELQLMEWAKLLQKVVLKYKCA